MDPGNLEPHFQVELQISVVHNVVGLVIQVWDEFLVFGRRFLVHFVKEMLGIWRKHFGGDIQMLGSERIIVMFIVKMMWIT